MSPLLERVGLPNLDAVRPWFVKSTPAPAGEAGAGRPVAGRRPADKISLHGSPCKEATMLRHTQLLLAVLCVAACASSSAATPRRTRDVITAEEIARTRPGTAYDVVEALRPEFLRSRGPVSTDGTQEYAVVYLDGVRAGGLIELRRVPAEVLAEIRYISGPDATTRYGTGHAGGAILITTKR